MKVWNTNRDQSKWQRSEERTVAAELIAGHAVITVHALGLNEKVGNRETHWEPSSHEISMEMGNFFLKKNKTDGPGHP